jgi:hypothetical protein
VAILTIFHPVLNVKIGGFAVITGLVFEKIKIFHSIRASRIIDSTRKGGMCSPGRVQRRENMLKGFDGRISSLFSSSHEN